MIFGIIQGVLLCGGQVFLKIALAKLPPFAWTRTFWFSLLTNWHLAASGLLIGAASLLWMYMIKHFPFSIAYPMVSLSFVFGTLAAVLFFHEEVSLVKWMGVAFIVVGCVLIAK